MICMLASLLVEALIFLSQFQACADEVEAAGSKAHEAEVELGSKHALIQSLEEDLLAAQKAAASAGEPARRHCAKAFGPYASHKLRPSIIDLHLR